MTAAFDQGWLNARWSNLLAPGLVVIGEWLTQILAPPDATTQPFPGTGQGGTDFSLWSLDAIQSSKM